MQSGATKCIQYVDGQESCIFCNGKCVRNGTANNKQRYLCKICKRCFVGSYSYKACEQNIDLSIKEHIKEGCGIRSTARLLKIGTSTVLRRIIIISKLIRKPTIAMSKEYELDELCTYVKRKTNLRWVVYAIRKDTKEVMDFSIGNRTNKTLKRVTDTLILSAASQIYTDKLQQYGYLIPKEIHNTKQYGTNHIERKNLSLRTHLKRLNRRTICFSKNVAMLSACLKIYFWG